MFYKCVCIFTAEWLCIYVIYITQSNKKKWTNDVVKALCCLLSTAGKV